jgi:hypothetical protein
VTGDHPAERQPQIPPTSTGHESGATSASDQAPALGKLAATAAGIDSPSHETRQPWEPALTPAEIDCFLRYVHSRPITVNGQQGTLYIAPFRVVPEEPSVMMRGLKEALELSPEERAKQRARLDKILDDARERRETYRTEGYYPDYPDHA